MSQKKRSAAGGSRKRLLPASLAFFLLVWAQIPAILATPRCLLADSPYKEIAVRDGGTIRGFVRLNGTAAADERFDVTKDPKQCGRAKLCPALRVGKNGGVKNAVVYLEGVKEGKKFSGNMKPPLIQKNCEYEPHVMVVPAGAQLDIANNDPILHNVHAYGIGEGLKSLFNIAQPIKGQRTCIKQTQLKDPGVVLTLCDAGHPWMTAYILVAEHPYYAVTDEGGNFVIENVPPGSYRITMWHEGVHILKKDMESGKVKKYHFEDPYVLTQEVGVPAGGTVDLKFDLALR